MDKQIIQEINKMKEAGIQCDVKPGQPLKGANRYKKLYHFTSFNSFVKIWLSKKLLFSSAKNVNDIFENTEMWRLSNANQLPLIAALNEQRWAYKQISLTMDYDSYQKGFMSTSMWGIYGDKNNGVCIELDFENLSLSEDCIYSPIEYKEKIEYTHIVGSSIQTRHDVEKYLLEIKDKLFFTKDITWKGENEFRILSNKKESLNISSAISAVYVTKCDSTECLLVENLVQDSVPVRYLHIQQDGDIVVCLAKKYRQDKETTSNDPTNTLEKMRKTANEYYLANCNDWNKPLLLNNDIAF